MKLQEKDIDSKWDWVYIRARFRTYDQVKVVVWCSVENQLNKSIVDTLPDWMRLSIIVNLG